MSAAAPSSARSCSVPPSRSLPPSLPPRLLPQCLALALALASEHSSLAVAPLICVSLCAHCSWLPKVLAVALLGAQSARVHTQGRHTQCGRHMLSECSVAVSHFSVFCVHVIERGVGRHDNSRYCDAGEPVLEAALYSYKYITSLSHLIHLYPFSIPFLDIPPFPVRLRLCCLALCESAARGFPCKIDKPTNSNCWLCCHAKQISTCPQDSLASPKRPRLASPAATRLTQKAAAARLEQLASYSRI